MLRALYVLVFLEIHSGRILYVDCTAHPNSAWVTQQARNLSWELNQPKAPIRLAVHDRDAKFVDEFDRVLRSEGLKVVVPVPPASGTAQGTVTFKEGATAVATVTITTRSTTEAAESSGAGKAQENNDGAPKPDHVLVAQTSHPGPNLAR